MQFTISLLPVNLSLVHIPRPRLSQLSHPILKQILQPDPVFFNLTCNDLELSIFAHESMLDDFEVISRKDRQRQRSRSNSSSSRKSFKPTREIHPVEISYEKWSVLQVDSHTDQLDNAGARVNEVSAPLAAAGISILYQSSYMSDFIFVKTLRLAEAMDLLAAAGFDIYSTDAASPISPSPVVRLQVCPHATAVPSRVSTRAHSSLSDTRHGLQKIDPSQTSEAQNIPRKYSPSPAPVEVRLLPSHLACIGLSDDLGLDHWALKIVKLVVFPELISSPTFPRSPQPVVASASKSHPLFFDLAPLSTLWDGSPLSSTSSCMSDEEDDGYFSHSPTTLSYSPNLTPPSRCHSETFKATRPRRRSTDPSFSCVKNNTLPESARRVPFLSYTRTSEGSSLTADVYVLSTLFPQSERHMINSSGELDEADRRLRTGVGTEQLGHMPDSGNEAHSHMNVLSCLQIDLQRFGLDKHGLVNRFSQVLRENGINHMYSSTFKTANILVDKKHARHAQSLLCTC